MKNNDKPQAGTVPHGGTLIQDKVIRMTKLFSALEIVAMGLPGLPTTKARLIDRATAERWYFEEETGRGGKRRMYQVPAMYLEAAKKAAGAAGATAALATVAPGATAPASPGMGGGIDADLLALAIRAFEEWATPRQLVITPERKAAVIVLLYDYLARGAKEKEIEAFLQLVA